MFQERERVRYKTFNRSIRVERVFLRTRTVDDNQCEKKTSGKFWNVELAESRPDGINK